MTSQLIMQAPPTEATVLADASTTRCSMIYSAASSRAGCIYHILDILSRMTRSMEALSRGQIKHAHMQLLPGRASQIIPHKSHLQYILQMPSSCLAWKQVHHSKTCKPLVKPPTRGRGVRQNLESPVAAPQPTQFQGMGNAMTCLIKRFSCKQETVNLQHLNCKQETVNLNGTIHPTPRLVMMPAFWFQLTYRTTCV